jgi:hypothetical protein
MKSDVQYWHLPSLLLHRGDMSGVGCKREVTGPSKSDAYDCA